jgi:hypothetical protein
MIDREGQNDFWLLNIRKNRTHRIERDLLVAELVKKKDAPLGTSASLDSLNDPRECRLECIFD